MPSARARGQQPVGELRSGQTVDPPSSLLGFVPGEPGGLRLGSLRW
jgi:hypothetical protein